LQQKSEAHYPQLEQRLQGRGNLETLAQLRGTGTEERWLFLDMALALTAKNAAL
jgi:hypothetical protein